MDRSRKTDGSDPAFDEYAVGFPADRDAEADTAFEEVQTAGEDLGVRAIRENRD
ncbi:hypothetical protein I4300191C4_16680 [Solibaculum mannosilyticum]